MFPTSSTVTRLAEPTPPRLPAKFRSDWPAPSGPGAPARPPPPPRLWAKMPEAPAPQVVIEPQLSTPTVPPFPAPPSWANVESMALRPLAKPMSTLPAMPPPPPMLWARIPVEPTPKVWMSPPAAAQAPWMSWTQLATLTAAPSPVEPAPPPRRTCAPPTEPMSPLPPTPPPPPML